ncbi:MAG: Crp/Fnr family transcriptional regulator [Gammaproteobacteria bacterium]|nr:Crp/Fnr family transcriptional regulator [Gammaproteobacteria bacterium]
MSHDAIKLDDNTLPQWLDLFPELKQADSVCNDICSNATELVFDAGQWIFREGDECPAYILCLEGKIRIQKVSTEGREIMLYRIKPGQGCVLTTASLLSGTPYMAESITETKLRAMSISKEDFFKGLAMSPDFRDFIFTAYGSQLASVMQLVKDIAFDPLDIRLARRLLADADDEGILNVTHQDLATSLGSVREVITRELKKLKQKGWIDRDRGKVQITNHTEISRFAIENNLPVISI